jgi:uncharacterized protein involved in cysteine biosynthesis
MKFLLVCAMVLSIVCLVLAVFHWVHLRRDLKKGSTGIATQRPVWLEFPRAYTRQGRHHQRRLFVYLAVFIVLLIVLFIIHGANFTGI